MTRPLSGIWLGRRAYEPVHRLQHALQRQRLAGEVGDTVLFVEHEPVITLGRGAARAHLLAPSEELDRRGVGLSEVGRGGDITLHAPGQLVCYPIIDLAPDRRDVRRYVRDLNETMRRLALDFGIEGGTLPEYIGLWVDAASPQRWPGTKVISPTKLGAVGVRISRWVTMHGFAFNLTTDLELYRLIVPCGIARYPVTSVERLTGTRAQVASTAKRALEHLSEVLDRVASPLCDRSSGALDTSLLSRAAVAESP